MTPVRRLGLSVAIGVAAAILPFVVMATVPAAHRDVAEWVLFLPILPGGLIAFLVRHQGHPQPDFLAGIIAGNFYIYSGAAWFLLGRVGRRRGRTISPSPVPDSHVVRRLPFIFAGWRLAVSAVLLAVSLAAPQWAGLPEMVVLLIDFPVALLSFTILYWLLPGAETASLIHPGFFLLVTTVGCGWYYSLGRLARSLVMPRGSTVEPAA